MSILKFSKASALSVLALTLTLGAAPNSAKAEPDAFIGEIFPMGIVGFCPRGSASAEGQLLAISQNSALFSLLGTIYGGDGRTTFALPDLRSRVPIGVGNGPGLASARIGQRSGSDTVTLSQGNLASHKHNVNVTNADGDKPGPGGKLLAAAPDNGTGTETIYSDQPATVTMSSNMIAPAGQSRPFSNLDPASVIRYCIALQGVYPSRN